MAAENLKGAVFHRQHSNYLKKPVLLIGFTCYITESREIDAA
jgi:hypothetical protein